MGFLFYCFTTIKLAVGYMDKHVHFERVATVDGIIISKIIMSLEFYTAFGVIVLVDGSYRHDEILVTKVKGLIGVKSFLGIVLWVINIIYVGTIGRDSDAGVGLILVSLL
ncbi:hypothetical protein ACTFIV_008323 [Dictyostelium citrinum]